MLLIVQGLLVIIVGGYLLYYGLSSLVSQTEGTAGSRTSRILAALVGVGILVIGIAMLFVR